MDHVVPRCVRLQEQLAERVEIEEVEELGAMPPSRRRLGRRPALPAGSTSSSTSWRSSPATREMRECELIYVLDSPELAPELLPRAAQLHELYRVPFRVAILSRNGGFAVATNLGASLARGRACCCLNSDVLPDRPGWLGRLAQLLRLAAGGRGAGPEAAVRRRLDPARRPRLQTQPGQRRLGERPTASRACTADFAGGERRPARFPPSAAPA